MEEEGRVLEVKDGYALVGIEKKGACGDCITCGMCGGERKGAQIFHAPCGEGVARGDIVRIQFDGRILLRGALYMVGIPFAGILAAIAAAGLVENRALKTILFITVSVAAFIYGTEKGSREGRKLSGTIVECKKQGDKNGSQRKS